MATLVLQSAGGLVGEALGGPIGAALGRGLGGLAARAITGSGGSNRRRSVEGPRLKDLDGVSATEGAPIPRLYGRARIGGQLIWATRFDEEVSTATTTTGRRGGKSLGRTVSALVGGGGSTTTTETVTYRYFANLAIGLCEGPIAFVRRVWADGKLVDTAALAMRVHTGTETQEPDPLIVAKQGADNAPAYRGLAYVVFEHLPLEGFGNRVPQFSFEVVRPVGGLGAAIRAVDLIPGAGEFVYETRFASQALGEGASRPENRHQTSHATDWTASLDALQALCPNLESVALVVAWFGDDLRVGRCTIRPKVEIAAKTTTGADWAVAGLTRATALPVSTVDGRPAYGGTPSDASVVRAIQDLKARGLSVLLYPFVMMDVPAGNALPDPWSGAATQPAYPWRGRITCDPAPGRAGSPDGTAAAASQMAALFGAAMAAQHAIASGSVVYSGPAEWTLRRLVLHCAGLAGLAGGVDALLIGSEFAALTRVRSASGVYPAVQQLVALAIEVRALVGSATKLSYAADWTEYGSHVPVVGELRFPLDPLWSRAEIDFVGLDWYPPLSDWRDGSAHADAALAPSTYDRTYLRDRVASGPAFDWYYASDADRTAGLRTPISDGAYGKPWVYRAKDLAGWWSNPHVERVAGAELGTATGWVPRSKPIWLTEVGIPAVDRGANGPNVFPDPKSSESELPPFSRGRRDDLIQANALMATLARFDPAVAGFQDSWNPVSPLFGGRMVEPSRIHVWAWDARPFPPFPSFGGVWADAANWLTGHWITGRLEGAPLDDLIGRILVDFGLPAADRIEADGFLDGYVIDRPMSAEAALEPLLALFGAACAITGGRIRFVGRAGRSVATLDPATLVPDGDGHDRVLARAGETTLPAEIAVGFTDGEGDYRRAAAASRRLATGSRSRGEIDTAAVLPRAEAQRLADVGLQDLWTGRETLAFGLPPGRLDLEIGDVVTLAVEGRARPFRISRIRDAGARRIEARAIEPGLVDVIAGPATFPALAPPPVAGPASVTIVDLPVAAGEPPVLQALVVDADPWVGGYTLWRSETGASYAPVAGVPARAGVGVTLDVLPAGPLWRFDRASRPTIRLTGAHLAAVDPLEALAGANALAVQGPDGLWEVITFAGAELVASDTWRLSTLVRGLGGSEAAALRPVPEGARVVLLDGRLLPLAVGTERLGVPGLYRLSPAGRDHGDPMTVSFTATPGPAALLPLAPVRLAARRVPEGVRIDWIRRTRTGGDGWEQAEVPLGEESERYEVDVLAGATVRRTLRVTTPMALYAAADELADFGAPQTALSLVVAQVSAAVGRGAARAATLTL